MLRNGASPIGLALLACLLAAAPAEAGRVNFQQHAIGANNYQEAPQQQVTPSPQVLKQEAPVVKPSTTTTTTTNSAPSVAVQAAQQPAEAPEAPAAPVTHAAQPATANGDYTLGTGDRIRVTVFGEPDLSGEFAVDSTGKLSMPLAGDVQANGMTVSQVAKTVERQLSTGYLKNPKVSIEVLNYRPFFILGEVMKPGSYPYVNGLTVVGAVALAGGYTYRASNDNISIVRVGDASKKGTKVDETTPVLPGDTVRVEERFF